MDDRFLKYYEQELTYIREMGVEFSKKYPKIAGRLLLEAGKSEDPHTERLIEAFAFLCGRIHQKIDDDFPEIINSLFNIIYPHYISPVPSCSVVQFKPIMANVPETGYEIPSGSKLFTKPVDGTPCTFRTAMDAQLWPVEILSAKIADPPKLRDGTQTALNLQLQTRNDFPLSELGWNSLRFFINGQSHHVFPLYELLMNNVCHVECEIEGKRKRKETLDLGPDALTPAGFGKDESLFPQTSRSFTGYRFLLEYFCFPEKYLFFDLNNLDKLKGLGDQTNISLWLHLNTFPKSKVVVDKNTFCLHATTAVNLFKKIAEPIRVEQHKTEYKITPSLRKPNAFEVYSVDKVSAITGEAENEVVELKPFYSVRHHLDAGEEQGRPIFWHMHRKDGSRHKDSGTDVFLSFVDLAFKSTDPSYQVWTAHVTCNNRDLPARLPLGHGENDFTMEIAAPLEGIKCLLKPTETRRLGLDGSLQWKLISHFSLNYLSVVQEGETALKEILSLYDFADSASTRQQIQGIVSLKSEHVTRRIGASLGRGVKVILELDEANFIGSGLFLFASVLERFLGQYVSINSFIQMELISHKTHEVIKIWPPRSGEQRLL